MIFGIETVWEDLNNGLVLIGLGISFSTLQDPTKTQNKLSRIVYENPKYAKCFIIYLVIMTFGFLGFGLYGWFFSENENTKEISFGFIVLAIGLIGMLKVALEMAEHHSNKSKNS